LGTAFHRHPPATSAPRTTNVCTRRWFRDEPLFAPQTQRPYAWKPGTLPAVDLIRERISFIDCSALRSLSTPLLRAFGRLPPVRDLLALTLDRWQVVDPHSGYFTDPQVWARIHAALRGELPRGEVGNEVLRD
jgi:hypothetical protein